LGASTFWNPQGLPRPVMGLLFLSKLVAYAEDIIGEYQGVLQWGRTTFDQTVPCDKYWEILGNRRQMYRLYLLIFKKHMKLYGEIHNLGFLNKIS
jgi:hypothetical protein